MDGAQSEELAAGGESVDLFANRETKLKRRPVVIVDDHWGQLERVVQQLGKGFVEYVTVVSLEDGTELTSNLCRVLKDYPKLQILARPDLAGGDLTCDEQVEFFDEQVLNGKTGKEYSWLLSQLLRQGGVLLADYNLLDGWDVPSSWEGCLVRQLDVCRRHFREGHQPELWCFSTEMVGMGTTTHLDRRYALSLTGEPRKSFGKSDYELEEVASRLKQYVKDEFPWVVEYKGQWDGERLRKADMGDLESMFDLVVWPDDQRRVGGKKVGKDQREQRLPPLLWGLLGKLVLRFRRDAEYTKRSVLGYEDPNRFNTSIAQLRQWFPEDLGDVDNYMRTVQGLPAAGDVEAMARINPNRDVASVDWLG